MKIDIKVPSAGESVSEATVSRIIKASGSTVKTDEEILELETDKVNQVVYAPGAGKLTLNVKVDDVVAVGSVIGSVDTEAKGEAAPAPAPVPKKEAASPPPPPAPTAEKSARKMPSDFVAEMKAPAPPTPAPAAEPTPKAGERKRMSKLRKTIAERLVAVKNTTAMLTTFNEVDMSNIMAIRAREQENFVKRYGIKLGFMSFFVKACAAALKEFPAVNSMIDGDEILTFSTYDIGVAVSTDRGLLVPVLRGCDKKSFGDVEKDIAAFAQKARSGSISIDDLQGGSFTITNGGVFGSLLSTPILNPPQAAILGMHNIVKRAVVENDQIVIRPMMYLALSYDHRLIDGRESVLFLVHLKRNLEDPTRLLLDL